MKVYSISKRVFYGICILILILPVSHHWRLFLTGRPVTGTVGEFIIYPLETRDGTHPVEYASEVHFYAGEIKHTAYGPANYKYRKGRRMKVIYNKKDPADNCIVSFSGFYLNNYTALPLIILIFWASFYLSFNRYRRKQGKMEKQKKQKKQKSSTLLQEVRRILPLLLATWIHTVSMAAVHHIFPAAGTGEINLTINRALPGDTLLFHPGTYTGPFQLEHLQGLPGKPVVIMGSTGKEGVLTTIDGGASPGMGLQQYAFWLRNCAWITLENLIIRNCWTDLVRAEESAYISVRHCRLHGGKRALYATGRGSHHFLMEHCSWEQDERVWSHRDGFSWEELHHGKQQHYNGSLFQGSGISGVFVLRDNRIQNTFNAFRLAQINDGTTDPLACTNGEIYRNIIINTSDNVLEPEMHARNLFFYHNRMINGHAFISITEVSGGDIYIYGNSAVSLPGSGDGWTVFKLSSRKRALTRPLYIFNNSWQVDFDIIGSPHNIWKNDHIRHFNNACYAEASDTFGIYNLGADNHFDYDCSNVPFPEILVRNRMERHGRVADPMFRDPYGGDFRLRKHSPCIDRGQKDGELIPDYRGRRPDIGAWEGEELVQGRPFRYWEPNARVPYRELPRITRVRLEPGQVTLWFSLPMDAFSLKAISKSLRCGETDHRLVYSELSGEGYSVTLSVAGDPVPSGEPAGNCLLLFSEWPQALNGRKLTAWASEIPVFLK